MNIALIAPIVAFSCLLPIQDLTSTAPSSVSSGAVGVVAPESSAPKWQPTTATSMTRLDDTLRAELQLAEQSASDLGSMRAGGLSNNEWTWLAIGAGIVLLIVLI